MKDMFELLKDAADFAIKVKALDTATGNDEQPTMVNQQTADCEPLYNGDCGPTYDDYRHETYDEYAGSYAQEYGGYSDQDINDAFDGDPEAYWNID